MIKERDNSRLMEEMANAEITLGELEERYLLMVYKHCQFDVSLTARTLGISRSATYRKINEIRSTDEQQQ